MPTPTNLQELYVAELRDLWSANDQMQTSLRDLVEKTKNDKLKELLQTSIRGIGHHTETLRSVVNSNGANSSSKCTGMEGLVQELNRHAIEADLSPQLRDLEIIAQYQRMSHYGIAGFGTAAAYAEALGQSDDATKLKKIVSDIYRADDYSSRLAEQAQQAVTQG